MNCHVNRLLLSVVTQLKCHCHYAARSFAEPEHLEKSHCKTVARRRAKVADIQGQGRKSV